MASQTHKGADSEAWRQRELQLAREIAHAFLSATHPLEVYRIALARVTPLVDASFSSVFLRDPQDSELLKLECAQNWPQSSARFLSQLRIRVGRGPTGRAVAERVAVEVEDVFKDPRLIEWHEPARELGFHGLVALPLQAGNEVLGALSFYFAEPHAFGADELHLLQLLADQLASTAVRAHQVEDLRVAHTKLKHENADLRARVGEAEEAKRLKDEFLANMSHELRTPLNSILGYAYLLLEGQTGPLGEATEKAVSKINGSATVLLHLITDLLELSQLKLGRAEVVHSMDDAIRIARRAAEAAGPPPPNVAFSIEGELPEMPIITDSEKATKILENLLSNAFKFTAQGTVQVKVKRVTRPGGPCIEWEVSDSGIGIPPERREGIFDEFTQVDGSSTRLYGGTGLGLALSRKLAELLGGSVDVDATPGGGSTFVLRIPARATN